MLEIFTEVKAYFSQDVLNDLEEDLKTLLERNNIAIEVQRDSEDDRQYICGSWTQIQSIHHLIKKHVKTSISSGSSDGSKTPELIVQELHGENKPTCYFRSAANTTEGASKPNAPSAGDKARARQNSEEHETDIIGEVKAEVIVPERCNSGSSDEGENMPLLRQAIRGNIQRGYLRTYVTLRERLKRDRRMDSYFRHEPRHMHHLAKRRRTDTNADRGDKADDLDKDLQELEDLKEIFDLFDLYDLYSCF